MPKPPKPCKYSRNPVTGRCYTAREAEQAKWQEKWLKQEQQWEAESQARMREIERKLARARERERVAGRAAEAEMRVRLRQRAIDLRVREAEAREERDKAVRTAQGLLRKLSALSARTPGEAREKMQLESDYQKAAESLRKAGDEAFYRKRPRATVGLNGLHCIFGR